MNLFTFIVWGFLCFGVGYLMRGNVAVSPEHKELLDDLGSKATEIIDDRPQLKDEIDQLKLRIDELVSRENVIMNVLTGRYK